jgi:hypothetical protein
MLPRATDRSTYPGKGSIKKRERRRREKGV